MDAASREKFEDALLDDLIKISFSRLDSTLSAQDPKIIPPKEAETLRRFNWLHPEVKEDLIILLTAETRQELFEHIFTDIEYFLSLIQNAELTMPDGTQYGAGYLLDIHMLRRQGQLEITFRATNSPTGKLEKVHYIGDRTLYTDQDVFNDFKSIAECYIKYPVDYNGQALSAEGRSAREKVNNDIMQQRGVQQVGLTREEAEKKENEERLKRQAHENREFSLSSAAHDQSSNPLLRAVARNFGAAAAPLAKPDFSKKIINDDDDDDDDGEDIEYERCPNIFKRHGDSDTDDSTDEDIDAVGLAGQLFKSQHHTAREVSLAGVPKPLKMKAPPAPKAPTRLQNATSAAARPQHSLGGNTQPAQNSAASAQNSAASAQNSAASAQHAPARFSPLYSTEDLICKKAIELVSRGGYAITPQDFYDLTSIKLLCEKESHQALEVVNNCHRLALSKIKYSLNHK